MARPLALSLSGFSFSYRSNYFDWRLLHGIDVDTVIRLTDVKAVEDCLDTLQHGAFGAERDRLSPANCVQLFRLLQLAVEYCAHLRAAHALLLDCYGAATAAAEDWKVSARAYLDAGGAFLAESMAAGSLSRPYLDATDTAKAGLENADRSYNAVLDTLEAEDSRARHFRFRKHRTELSWATLHAADADRLVASLDLAALEGLMPNLTYGSITNEDDEQLTPHHFGQIIPLAQAALDYVLWQANATGALLEQSMAGLQSSCGDIPLLTTATQEMHANITSLLLEAQQMGGVVSAGAGGMVMGYSSGVGGGLTDTAVYGAGFGSQSASAGLGGPVGPWASASVDVGQSHGQNACFSNPLLHHSPDPSAYPVPALPSGGLEELLAGAAGGGGAGLPVMELHSRTAELSSKVESIEHDLRVERSKTDEMRRILADVRDRLNQRPPGTAGAIRSPSLQAPERLAPSGGGHSRYSSAAGINLGSTPAQPQQPDHLPSHSPAKVR
ncbi:hypothetical protein TSOC_005003, partial [Tetrabaena socialis]